MTFRTAFLEWAITRFPGLGSELNGESRQSRLHFAFERFRNETQLAIDDHSEAEVTEFFQMADRVIANSYPKMKSLFHVVFVEHLRFDNAKTDRSWALKLLTPRLKDEFVASLGCGPALRDALQQPRG